MRPIDFFYFGVLGIGALLAAIRFPALRAAEKMIALLLLSTLLHESVPFAYFIQGKNNVVFLRLFSLAEFTFVSAYYFLLIPNRYLRVIIGLLLAVGAFWFLFPLTKSFVQQERLSFLLFEAVSIIVISLFFCLHLALREIVNPLKSASFWITTSFIIYWSIAYMRFGLLTLPGNVAEQVRMVLENAFFVINIAFYMALAAILFFYKRLSASL